jgi:hypothetical protein
MKVKSKRKKNGKIKLTLNNIDENEYKTLCGIFDADGRILFDHLKERGSFQNPYKSDKMIWKIFGSLKHVTHKPPKKP